MRYMWNDFLFWDEWCISEICPPGQNPNLTDTSQCIDCQIGYFSAVNASNQCEVCPNNLTTSDVGSTAESDCEGQISFLFILSFAYCKFMKIGMQSVFRLFVRNYGLQPPYVFIFSAECPIGQYPNASDTTTCVPCAIGSYKDVTGSASCTPCAWGFSTVDAGSENSTDCYGRGTYHFE